MERVAAECVYCGALVQADADSETVEFTCPSGHHYIATVERYKSDLRIAQALGFRGK